MRSLLLVFILGLSLSLSSCGYTTRSNLPSNIRTIYVQPFKNSVTFTTEGRRDLYLPLMEVKVRNAIVDRFLFDGNLKVSQEDVADYVLKGELVNYERSGLRFTDNDDVQEYRITVTVSLEMWDQNKNEMVWKESGFSGEATYFVSGPRISSEDDAVNNAMIDLARRIVERTVEDW